MSRAGVSIDRAQPILPEPDVALFHFGETRVHRGQLLVRLGRGHGSIDERRVDLTFAIGVVTLRLRNLFD
jgi:hypothetical protein